ncbi:MAG: TonB-dependent receptor [Glaciecola sp.]|jgi:outer membrane receptor for Fe3+-dicitrate
MNTKLSYLSLACLAAMNTNAMAEEEATEAAVERIQVVGKSVSYANNETTESMLKQQSNLTSVLAGIDNLPGVLINEGDTFGSDDWSTTVSIRGFQISLDEQQIGITVDGIANGNSNYGGGAKANRFIDTENLALIEVSQGTADIASRSNEALGGTLNFTTISPTEEENLLMSVSLGDFDARKYFVRYNTGEIARDTYAWVSVSSASNTDWVNQSAENRKDHIAAKLISDLNAEWGLSAYVSYDDSHEDNYQRVSKAQFETNPESDRLTAEWTGVPYVDQLYRKGWSTLRENLFAYVQADYESDNLSFSGNVYFHDNSGRGDWVPPYLNDLTVDTGRPETELDSTTTVRGGSSNGIITFVDREGFALAPTDNCVSSIVFPYGGAGPAFDAGCFGPEAIPVGSYRHTHYGKQRFGFNADLAYIITTDSFENVTRAGIWYEDYSRDEYRDWHKIIDSASSFEFDHTPYWIQYDRSFAVDTTMLYLENEIDFEWAKARVGVKKFIVELDSKDNFDASNNVAGIDSDSDALLSAGIVANLPIEGLEVFAGYAENFAAIKDTVLERDASTLTQIEPETAENFDLGLRYNSEFIDASLTFYSIDFENRITFLPPDTPDAGIDYNIGTNGSYVNVGGIESEGIEASLSIQLGEYFSLYGSYTNNESTYKDVPDELGLGIEAGNTVFGSVEDMFVVSLDYNKGNYSAGLSNKYVGDRFIDAANTSVAEAYSVADLYAAVDIEPAFEGVQNMQVRFTLNNLFDESYLGGIAGQSAWIGAPRTAAVNLQFTF